MKTVLCLLFSAFCFSGCLTVPAGTQADPAQVARISTVATTLAHTAAAIQLQKEPEARQALLAVAEAIEQAAAQPQAPQPSNLVQLASAAATKFAGPYGALAGVGLQAGFGLYQQFYAANAQSALDKQPAFKAVLYSLAGGIRAAAQADGSPAAPASGPSITAEELVLRPAR